jgi:hypothetical protein
MPDEAKGGRTGNEAGPPMMMLRRIVARTVRLAGSLSSALQSDTAREHGQHPKWFSAVARRDRFDSTVSGLINDSTP